jgi:hypothetical protein
MATDFFHTFDKENYSLDRSAKQWHMIYFALNGQWFMPI